MLSGSWNRYCHKRKFGIIIVIGPIVWVYSSLLFAVCILLLRLYIDRLLHWSYCQNQFLMESGCDRVYLEFGSKFYPELRKCRMSVTFVIINSVISVLGGHWLHYTSCFDRFLKLYSLPQNWRMLSCLLTLSKVKITLEKDTMKFIVWDLRLHL